MAEKLRAPHRPERAAVRKKRGFSLVDLLVAFTIFSMALLATLTIFPASMQSIRKARMNTMATHLAQSALESVFNQSFATIANSAGSTTMTSTLNGSQETVTFTTTITVNSLSSDLKDVSVRVSWSEDAAGSLSHNVTLETYVVNKG
jgi:type II secretory pathway pseudopilin PulG